MALTGRDPYNRPRGKYDAINEFDLFRAEEVINQFLQKYPNSDLFPIAKQALSDVQEELADGYFYVAGFLFDKGDNTRALSLLKTIINRYPNFSHIDEVKQWYDYLSTSGQQPQEMPQE